MIVISWLYVQVLADQLPTVVEKAVASEQHSEGETTDCLYPQMQTQGIS